MDRASTVAHIALINGIADIINFYQDPLVIKPGASEQRRGTTHGGVVVKGLRIHQKALGADASP